MRFNLKKFRLPLSLCAAACLSLSCLTSLGCLGSPKALPMEYAAGLQMVTEKIADQGVLDKWLATAGANVQNPGLESYVTIRTSVGVRIVGMNGEFGIEAGGDGTQLPPGMREELIAQLALPISDEQRNAILVMLGWNREPAAPTP